MGETNLKCFGGKAILPNAPAELRRFPLIHTAVWSVTCLETHDAFVRWVIEMQFRRIFCATSLLALLWSPPVCAETTLRIAMTASDIPTTTGLPNNGFEGMRFLGYPTFEGLVLWDLTSTEHLAGLRPGLAETWEQAADDNKRWIFHLRHGVKFHDGTDFNADAVIWNLDRYFKSDSPQYEIASSAMTRARAPLLGAYNKIDDLYGGDLDDQARLLFPLHGCLHSVHLARVL